MSGVGTDLGVIAAHHGHGAAQHAGLDAVDQGLGGAVSIHMGVAHAVQLLLDGLNGVAHTGLGDLVGNVHQLALPVLEVLDSHLDDCLGVVTGILSGELDELGVGHPADGRGGDELGVEALAQGAQCGEDALHVHHDGLAGAGQHHVLLVQEVTGHGDAVTHGDFIGENAKKIVEMAILNFKNRKPELVNIPKLKTTNMLIYRSMSNALYYPRAHGIKTGYTKRAGRILGQRIRYLLCRSE